MTCGAGKTNHTLTSVPVVGAVVMSLTEGPSTPQPTTTAQPAASHPPAAPAAVPDAPRDRPLGVTLIGVLYALFAGFFLLGGLVLVVGGGVIAGLLVSLIPGLGGQLGALGGVLIALIGILVAVVGVLLLLVTIGFFKGRGWAWTTVLILEAIGAAIDVLNLIDGDYTALLWIALAGLIIWYLFEPAAKAFFGKSHVRAFWQKEQAPDA